VAYICAVSIAPLGKDRTSFIDFVSKPAAYYCSVFKEFFELISREKVVLTCNTKFFGQAKAMDVLCATGGINLLLSICSADD
jgi:hypothetical protein